MEGTKKCKTVEDKIFPVLWGWGCEGLHREEAGVRRAKGEAEQDFPQLRQAVVPVLSQRGEASLYGVTEIFL